MFTKWHFIATFLFFVTGNSQKYSHTRYPGCSSTYEYNGPADIEALAFRMVSTEKTEQIKGYSGTVSIVGGSLEYSNEPYFAAITALKAGADHVQIFCYSTVGGFIKGFSPDVTVYPVLDTAVDTIFPYISKSDVVVLGPGLERDAHSLNVVMTKVINHCKLESKPLIIDVDEYFITQAVVNLMLKYPYPGIILTPNGLEFEKLYGLMKVSSASSDGLVSIDYTKYSENIFILRKGCTDTGISSNLKSSWSLAAIGSPKRCSGQGHMMAGAIGVYYFWALTHLPTVNSTDDPMFKASIAAYAGAKLIRDCNAKAYEKQSRSMIVTDMINSVSDVLYSN